MEKVTIHNALREVSVSQYKALLQKYMNTEIKEFYEDRELVLQGYLNLKDIPQISDRLGLCLVVCPYTPDSFGREIIILDELEE